jgi:Pyridine nucleotide-disulphide oxidoreductase
MTDVTPTARAAAWLSCLGDALAAPDIGAAVALFGSECYWRDLLTFTWNIKTMEGHEAIIRMLEATLAATAASAWTIVEDATETDGVVEAWFTFETGVARGKGHLRLRGDRGWTFLTTMTELKGHEERCGVTRENGVVHGASRDRRSWLERKSAHEAALGHAVQPYCVVIGGGQGGIALGARLKRLGVPAIIVEKNARAGDSWRNRYDSLVLHDPVWYDHLPYLPFPDHWPVFTPKDQMGDWLEAYAKIMELDYWAASPCVGARWDETRREWEVAIDRPEGRLLLRPKQLVFATGSYGPPHMPKVEGAETFAGELYHSSRYVGGEQYRGKRSVVVGAASSGHDVCADLWEHGAEVTMIQRSPTTVVKSETLMELGFFRGELGEATEGSIRTFCFARWPGKVKPGTSSYAMFSIMDFMPTFAQIIGAKMPTDRPIDGVDQTDVLFGKNQAGKRDSLLTFIGADLVAARWKQWRFYFTDVHPTGIGPQREPGMFSASAPMAGYPKVYNIEMDPHEDLQVGALFGWTAGPALEAVEKYLGSVKKYPNPPAPNITRFGGG